MLSSGHSFQGFFSRHLGKNLDRYFSDYSLFLTYKTSNCELKEMIISFLKFSNILPILVFVTLVPATYFVNLEVKSLELLPVLNFSLEYHLHNSYTSSYNILETSHNPIRLRNYKHSSLMPLNIIILIVSFLG
jgi:hypothetical protein